MDPDSDQEDTVTVAVPLEDLKKMAPAAASMAPSAGDEIPLPGVTKQSLEAIFAFDQQPDEPKTPKQLAAIINTANKLGNDAVVETAFGQLVQQWISGKSISEALAELPENFIDGYIARLAEQRDTRAVPSLRQGPEHLVARALKNNDLPMARCMGEVYHTQLFGNFQQETFATLLASALHDNSNEDSSENAKRSNCLNRINCLAELVKKHLGDAAVATTINQYCQESANRVDSNTLDNIQCSSFGPLLTDATQRSINSLWLKGIDEGNYARSLTHLERAVQVADSGDTDLLSEACIRLLRRYLFAQSLNNMTNSLSERSVAVLIALRDKGANMNDPHSVLANNSPLHHVLLDSRAFDLATRLIDEVGVNINHIYGANGRTLLIDAAINRDEEALTFLLAKGANKRHKTRERKTAHDYFVDSHNRRHRTRSPLNKQLATKVSDRVFYALDGISNHLGQFIRRHSPTERP
ncbi:MAG: ankyrin repeat domain-containing protein [Cellvibrionaceae bacterium]|nr:ankyrin repeat domain-containing protein [Cellvibrionaceae bacterium]